MIYHTTNGRGSWEEGTTYGSFSDLGDAVLRAVRTVEPRMDEFDVIAVQGASGMSLGFPVAYALDLDIVVVRKPNEDNHSLGERITGTSVKGQRVLFVDDFVSMGTTRARVREAVEAVGGKVVAQYMSREDDMLLL